MRLRTRIRKSLERITGVRLFRRPPHGINVFDDIARLLPDLRIFLILDVGANVGQSALAYAARFPGARILCFEPAPKTFAALRAATGRHANVRCFPVGFGAQRARVRMRVDTATMNRLVPHSGSAEGPATEFVDLLTLDEYCASEGIGQASYLKIDTEGMDLEVLKGARALLSAEAFDLVEVEAGMHPGNRYHVPLEDLKRHLEAFGYSLFGLYEQMYEWPSGTPQLRRCNAVFISARIARSHAGIRPPW